MNQIEVQIMGQSYLLGCPEGGEERLRIAGHRVDEAMCKIRNAGKVRARDRIAVLAALNLAFDLSSKVEEKARMTLVKGDPVEASQSDALRNLIDRLDDALNEDGQLL
jgi:cell division protein ZapA